MSTTEDTAAIDEKKEEETGGVKPDFKAFAANYVSSILFTIGFTIFIIGGLGLYTTKVAQANILPDNIDQAPYTIYDRVVDNLPIDINIMRPNPFSDNKDTFSQKVIFNSQEYLDSFDNSFLCSIKKNAIPSLTVGNLSLYISKVYESIIAKNFLAINKLFFLLSYLPEWLIMMLYGIFGIFIWFMLYFYNICISIFYHIVNIPHIFRTSFTDENGKVDENVWQSEKDISFFSLWKLFIFWIYFIIGLISVCVTPVFFTIYGLICPLFAKYKYKKENTGFIYGLKDFIVNTFVYKKLFFFILATLSLISNGSKYLGSNSIVGILIAIGFAYFMGLYSNPMPEVGINGFTSKIRQNMKQANVEYDVLKAVKICQQIPDIDIIQLNDNRQPLERPLTNPKENEIDLDGGDINELDPIGSAPTIPAIPSPSAPPYPMDNQSQAGGKKRTSLTSSNNKKYNIRLL
jgi:hypothetical protein